MKLSGMLEDGLSGGEFGCQWMSPRSEASVSGVSGVAVFVNEILVTRAKYRSRGAYKGAKPLLKRRFLCEGKCECEPPLLG